MRSLLLIGIGPGDPDALTLGAVRAMRRADVFFFLEKADAGRDALIDVRRRLLAAHAGDRPYRVVSGRTPARDRAAEDYADAVADWRDRRTRVIGDLIDRDLMPGETGGVLIWGDPGLYDGTLQSVQDLIAEGRGDLRVEVVPGIASPQALAARHRVPLNRVGESLTVTTGRLIGSADPDTVTNHLVMLDGRHAYRHLTGYDLDIHWGADLGTPDEVLIAGPLDAVADRIGATLDAKRAAKGWVMDSYLLRKRREGP